MAPYLQSIEKKRWGGGRSLKNHLHRMDEWNKYNGIINSIKATKRKLFVSYEKQRE